MRAPTPESRRYLVAGLSFESSIPLPAFEAEVPDVDVSIQPVHLPAEDGPWLHEGRRFKASPGRWLFVAPDGCRFLVEQGQRVAYDAPPGVGPSAVAAHIMQPVLATVLHQRDLLVLHAGAVETDAGAVIFMGQPVAGKSTLTAWLHSQGYGFIADDVCPVDVHETPRVAGGFRYQKLTAEAVAAVRPTGTAAPIDDDTRGRVRVAVRSRPAPAQRLARAYVLRPQPHATPVTDVVVEPLTGAAAFQSLVEHTYRRQYLRGLGGLAWHVEACTRVAASVPIHAVSFVPGACNVARLGAAILAHLDTVR